MLPFQLQIVFLFAALSSCLVSSGTLLPPRELLLSYRSKFHHKRALFVWQPSPSCTSPCAAFQTDEVGCTNDACLCNTAVLTDFYQCVQCDQSLEAIFNSTTALGAVSVFQANCQSEGYGHPALTVTVSATATSSSTAQSPSPSQYQPPSFCSAPCSALKQDFNTCENTPDDACICTSKIVGEFYQCAACDSSLISAWNATTVAGAVDNFQNICQSEGFGRPALPNSSGDGSSTTIIPTPSATKASVFSGSDKMTSGPGYNFLVPFAALGVVWLYY